MEWQEFLSFMRQGQTNTARFITSVSSPEDIGTYIVGMANASGGRIFIGMDLKNYHLLGSNTNNGWIEGVIKSFCRPQLSLQFSKVERNGKEILVIEIPKQNEKPYYFKNTSYMMDEGKPIIALAGKEEMQRQIREDNRNANHHLEAEEIEKITNELIGLATQEEQPSEPDFSPKYPTPEQAQRISAELNDRQKHALQIINEESSIRNKKYRELFKVSHKTAHLELVDLVDKGYIRSTGAGRSTCYISS